MQKVTGVLNAGSFKSVKFRETVKDFVAKDQALNFMKELQLIEKDLSQVLALVKQLGTPTFFLTLSCTDLRWNEIVTITTKLNEADFDISSLSYLDHCKILNENPVLVARHFQYRVETFCC